MSGPSRSRQSAGFGSRSPYRRGQPQLQRTLGERDARPTDPTPRRALTVGRRPAAAHERALPAYVGQRPIGSPRGPSAAPFSPSTNLMISITWILELRIVTRFESGRRLQVTLFAHRLGRTTSIASHVAAAGATRSPGFGPILWSSALTRAGARLPREPRWREQLQQERTCP